ncbi:MAG: AraC family transcriptional regulator ligand-binding domain-containing protein [Pseudomonadota bacterium]
MSMQDVSVQAYWVRGVAEQVGRDCPVLHRALATAEIPHDTIHGVPGFITYLQEMRFLDAMAEASGNDLVGAEMGLGMDPRRTSLLSYLLLNSATLADALQTLTRYVRLVRPLGSMRLEEAGPGVAIVIENDDPVVDLNRQHAEFAVAAALSAFRIATGTPLKAAEIHFAHPRRARAEEVARLLSAPVSFDTGRLEIVLERSTLALPLVDADASLLCILIAHAERLLEETRSKGSALRHEIEKAILQRLQHGVPASAAIARELGLSARTVARRLQEEGTSYREVCDTLRLRLAQSYLGDHSLSLPEIAFLLGYADQSSFTTAFKRMTGTTPGGWRSAA